ncbi:SUMF1/EgtB/PvdO family nonheme iron enzyme [Planctomycetota bacterium]
MSGHGQPHGAAETSRSDRGSGREESARDPAEGTTEDYGLPQTLQDGPYGAMLDANRMISSAQDGVAGASAGENPSNGLEQAAGSGSEVLDLEEEIDFSVGDGVTNPGAAAADASARELQRGTVLAERYEVRDILGVGGMGVVYQVYDRLRKKDIALKVMLPSLLARFRVVERFENEAEIMLALAHKNIVRAFDVGIDRDTGLRFFTMELLQGMTLRQWIDGREKAGARVSLEEAIEITKQLLEALLYAHEKTIHRDLNPENVFLHEEDGRFMVKVVDFGIAKLQSAAAFTMTSMALGTAYYMAPEQQFDAARVDQRADLYSLSVILYEMLTGDLPVGRFKAPSELRADLPKVTDQLVLKGLEAKPKNRFHSAKDMLRHVIEIRRMIRTAAKQQQQQQQQEQQLAARAAEAPVPTTPPQASKEQKASRQREPRRSRGPKEPPRKTPTDPRPRRASDRNARSKVSRKKTSSRAKRSKRKEAPERAPESEEPAGGRLPPEPRGGLPMSRFQLFVGAVAAACLLLLVGIAMRSGGNADRGDQPPGGNARKGWQQERMPNRMRLGSERSVYLWDTTQGIDIEMVYVPAGHFVMGNNSLYRDAKPDHRHWISSGYYMSRCETTWREYLAFCSSARRASPRAPAWGINGDHPVVNVSWNDAKAFCDWAGLALPTEAQWEKAARGPDERMYPWGEEAPTSALSVFVNHTDFGGRSTARVGICPRGASPFGALDMAGNVREWCADWYDENVYHEYRRGNLTPPTTGEGRVVRGGGWDDDAETVSAVRRAAFDPNLCVENLGFRPIFAPIAQ